MDSTEVQTGSCPKCQADRSEAALECVRCGIIFAKYRPVSVHAIDKPAEPVRAAFAWWPAAKEWLLETDTTTDSMTLYGRAVVFLGLLWWGRIFIMTPLESNYTGESFLHLINLPDRKSTRLNSSH